MPTVINSRRRFGSESVDPHFERIAREQRDAMVEPYLDTLPPETQRDIVTLFTFAPSELEQTPKNNPRIHPQCRSLTTPARRGCDFLSFRV